MKKNDSFEKRSDDKNDCESNATDDSIDSLANQIQNSLKLDESQTSKSNLKLDEKIVLKKNVREEKLKEIISFLASDKCTKVITIAGAGISTSAGIPDFRTKGTGVYSKLEKYNLPFPEAIFMLDYFRNNPKPFFELAKELYPNKNFEPTLSHRFVNLLESNGKLLRHYTQNIDMLEQKSGLSAGKLVEAHGHFRSGHCLDCGSEYDQEFLKQAILNDQIPKCYRCRTGVVKPDIVFFGENLPRKFFESLRDDFRQCQLLIVLGSSLTVEPFASLIYKVGENVPRLLINRELVKIENPLINMLRKCREFDFDGINETSNDAVLLGECDDSCRYLIEQLQWTDQLEKLQKTTENSL